MERMKVETHFSTSFPAVASRIFYVMYVRLFKAKISHGAALVTVQISISWDSLKQAAEKEDL